MVIDDEEKEENQREIQEKGRAKERKTEKDLPRSSEQKRATTKEGREKATTKKGRGREREK